MSVTLQTPFKDFTAAPGATLFSTDFRVILASDLVVRKDGVVQTTGFTVSGLGNPSGVDVTFGVPMVGGEKIELQRSVPLVRATDYQQTGDFLSPVVNTDFDRLWMALQDSQFLSALAILLPVGDPLAPMTIPDAVSRAGKYFAFDALGQAIAAAGAAGVPVSAFMATLLDDLNAAAARATLGAVPSGLVAGSGLTMATARLLGRITAATGAIEELTGASAQSLLPVQQARVDVASAATVNLTTGAPNTDHINITGATSITAFTVAAGRLLFVRIASGLSIANNANIVTQSGAAITAKAGDTFLIRATAANVVEILSYARGVPQALGDGQTLQTVTGARAFNTDYTNNTGRPIFVNVTGTTTGASASGNAIGLQVAGGAQYIGNGSGAAGGGWLLATFGVVPDGAVYRANCNNATLGQWLENRT